MDRRNFMMATSAAPLAVAAGSALMLTTDEVNAAPEPSAILVTHCKRILQQNLLKAGERLLLVTPYVYDPDFMLAFMIAAGELGARGAHMAIVPGLEPMSKSSSSFDILKPDARNGLTAWHWDLYASADLLITTMLGAPEGTPFPYTTYNAKVGNHPYKTDFDLINREGSKTRWLELSFPLHLQQRYFPTPERRKLTLDGAMLLDKTTTIKVTSPNGTNFTCTKRGRPGHGQYGIADHPGRWDNFAYGCVACMPNEDSGEGVMQLMPGDIILDTYPQVITDPIRFTFRGGYITKIEGPGHMAKTFSAYLAAFNNKEVYGTGHIGWGTHELTTLGFGALDDLLHYHHNRIGSVLLSLGLNLGHGTGGAGTLYSGTGNSTRVAPNHTHITMFGCSVQLDGQTIIDKGKMVMT